MLSGFSPMRTDARALPTTGRLTGSREPVARCSYPRASLPMPMANHGSRLFTLACALLRLTVSLELLARGPVQDLVYVHVFRLGHGECDCPRERFGGDCKFKLSWACRPYPRPDGRIVAKIGRAAC